VNAQLAVPLVIFIRNASPLATARGTLVRVVNVVTVPEAVPATRLGFVAVNTDVPFCVMSRVNAVDTSDVLVTITKLLIEPALGATSIGPTFVPVAPVFITNPMVRGIETVPELLGLEAGSCQLVPS
jgi:hypothetical protein